MRTQCALTTERRAGHMRSSMRRASSAMVLSGLIALPLPGRAVDGCLVLLCFAAPSWSSIQQCALAIRQVLDDLAQGHPFPSCSMAGAGNSAHQRWSNAPSFCPPQYTHVQWLPNGEAYTCDYDGAVEVDIDGAFWSRTWWRMSGGTVTDFSPAAKAQLGTWDTRFDDDYTSWLAQQPPANACAGC